ncbi:cytochrome P450 [Mycolicibacterium mengxianglii]|uniref:cytochrome P450 n=1 Tax=Mycolicibacterium mengxianglii TaxID=2736649 RepID=UPI0018D02CE5|nr:cytochrome P450 [Mycolicibacterium mengxianglii]
MGITTRSNGQLPPQVDRDTINLGTWEFWEQDDDFRDGAFATLRRESPVAFFPEAVLEDVPEDLPDGGFQPGPGHWALTRYDDVHFASRHPDIFSSASGITIGDQMPELAEYFGSMIALDDPRHQRLRSIVSRAFTPKVVARIEESVRDRAHRLVADMIERNPDGTGDVVTELAGPLPLQIICDMMGIPETDHEQVFHWTNIILGFGDPDLTTDFDEFVHVAMSIGGYAHALAEDRRTNPGHDLTSSLVQAEVDGERLTSAEVASFFILLAVAGNETTRNAISHGLLALSRYPEQRDLWWEDFDGLAPTAVEEMVRWASPVAYMRRTLTRDCELSGVQLSEGDKVTLWYGSANRDETKFADPWSFDVRRDPNPHLGFGGGGVHFCLGANLARREIRVMFEELRNQVPDVAATEEPSRLLSSFIHGIKRLPIAWTPPG